MVRHEKTNKKRTTKNKFNFKKSIKNFNPKFLFNEKILILILILIPIIISTHYRMAPSELDITEQWAWDTYKNQMKGQVSQQILLQYPNLPQAQRDQFINEQLNEIISQQHDQIEPQIKQTAEYFKSRMQDEKGNTYLLAIDPYLWLTQAENYVENGHGGDVKTEEGVSDLSRRNGVETNPTRFNVHSWLGAKIYKVVSFFDSNFTVQRSMFLLPVIIIALSIIPAFFLGRKIGGNLAGFVAGLIIALNTSLLGRTPAGFSDTDAYIILFPLFIIWTFIEALDAKKEINKYLLIGISGLTTVLFGFTWGVWWHIVGVILALAFVHFVKSAIIEWNTIKELKFKKIKNTKSFQTAIMVIGFLVSILIFNQAMLFITQSAASPQSGLFYPLEEIFIRPLGALGAKAVASTDVWPNVLTTVAELNSGSWAQNINSIGGKTFFIFGILGILLSMFRKNIEGEFEVRYAALLAIWFVGISLASIMSARFTALLAAPFAIAFGSAFGILFEKGSEFIQKHVQIPKLIPQILIVILLAFMLSNSFVQANQVAQHEVPSMTDEWHNSLTAIKDNSTDAIITSWWDFGHWFVNIAERKVTFDGGGQGKRIYWVGKSLMTSDVEENKDILRMLNCGQEEGYNRIKEFEKDSYQATEIITTITYQNKNEARETLLNAEIPMNKIDYILEKTHCSEEDLLDQYYIVSTDMVGKSGVWAHFGGWNFTKAKIYTIAKNNEFEAASDQIQELGFDQDKAEEFYFDAISLKTSRQVDTWMSPWPSYITQTPRSCVQTENNIVCNIQQGLGNQGNQQIVLDKIEIDITKPEEGKVIISVVQNGQIVGSETVRPSVISLDNGTEMNSYALKEQTTFPYEVVLVKKGENYQVLIADPALAKSVFSMLYYFDGKYMEGYEKISDRTTFTGQKIVVYKVNLKS